MILKNSDTISIATRLINIEEGGLNDDSCQQDCNAFE